MLQVKSPQISENRRSTEWQNTCVPFMHNAYILLSQAGIDTQKPPGGVT